MSRKTVVVIGAGPGLGMSVARRFGAEGHAVALVSRTSTRHAGYLADLDGRGVQAAAFTADVRDRDRLLAVLGEVAGRFGTIDVVYYGPGAADPATLPVPVERTGADDAREAMSWVYPALDVTGALLPGMTERGDGALLFAGGLSAVRPMPGLGALALSSAALRNYALTLNAGLADRGIYAGVLTIGGLIERGDIHAFATARPEVFGDIGDRTLDPDAIAAEAWLLYARRDRPEATFDVLT